MGSEGSDIKLSQSPDFESRTSSGGSSSRLNRMLDELLGGKPPPRRVTLPDHDTKATRLSPPNTFLFCVFHQEVGGIAFFVWHEILRWLWRRGDQRGCRRRHQALRTNYPLIGMTPRDAQLACLITCSPLRQLIKASLLHLHLLVLG